jgi:FtsP/CotA-like multicopper oxidase with cupredoxin domain
MVVSNQLEKEEGISIHWHGLHMKGANDMDGVVGVTQKAIPSGEDFTYEFDISGKQAGTFWLAQPCHHLKFAALTSSSGIILIQNFSGAMVSTGVLLFISR